MRRYLWLLICGVLLAPPVLAAKPAEKTAEQDARKQELSNELNRFVRDAINEGLLAPAGSTPAVPAPSAAAEEGRGELDRGASAPSDVWALAGRMDCGAPYPLDFSEFAVAATYSDILNYRAQLAADSVSSTEDPRLAKAYIALDMGSEAIMNLRSPNDPAEQALHHIALLLDGRGRPDIAYFQELAGCHEPAGLWLGVALLSEGQAAGAAHIDKAFNEFRGLPLQLRTSVTAIAAPTLDRPDGRFLLQKMLAAFTDGELRDSNQLQFANAILDMGQGSIEAEIRIRTFLLQGRFQEEALFALIRHNRAIDATLRAMLLDNMLVRIEQSKRDEDIRASVKFVLEELSAESRYMTMLDMAGRENMQSAPVQGEIKNHFIDTLRRDLASTDPLSNLAAIEALTVETGILENYDQRTALYEEATLKAVRLGFASLADQLSQKAQPGEDIAEQRATLAYRLKDYKSVFQLAETNPSNPQIGLVAALSAIDANDASEVQKFTSRLKLDDKTILALIEQDAASGRWIVPGRLYEMAAGIEDLELKTRVERVLSLRKAASGNVAMPPPSSIAAIPDRLMSARTALESLEREAN